MFILLFFNVLINPLFSLCNAMTADPKNHQSFPPFLSSTNHFASPYIANVNSADCNTAGTTVTNERLEPSTQLSHDNFIGVQLEKLQASSEILNNPKVNRLLEDWWVLYQKFYYLTRENTINQLYLSFYSHSSPFLKSLNQSICFPPSNIPIPPSIFCFGYAREFELKSAEFETSLKDIIKAGIITAGNLTL